MRTPTIVKSVTMMTIAASMIACATAPSTGGFSTVQSTARDRLGARVQWNRGSADDSAAARAVDSVLAHALSADAAVQVALLNNRHLQATYESVGVAQADLVQAGMLANPFFEGALRFGHATATTGVELNLVESFLNLLQRPMRTRVAAAVYDRAALDVADSVLDVAARTRMAYYDAQAAQQTRDLRATVADAAHISAELAARQHDAGNITTLDLAREQSLSDDATLQLTDADAELADRREALSALMGLWGTRAQWTIPARLPDVPTNGSTLVGIDSLETVALAHRLDLASARQAIVIEGTQAGLANAAALVPELDVGVSYEHDVEGNRSLGPTLGVRIPLFDQGQSLRAATRVRIRAAQEQYAAMAVDVRADVRRAYARLRAARSRAEYVRTVVLPLKTTIVRETQLRYNGMLAGVFELLQSKRDEVDAGIRYVAALRDYWMAHTELERAVGGRLPEGV
jgi:cobalt-zinc-cadmium efflux system outer membrane protein